MLIKSFLIVHTIKNIKKSRTTSRKLRCSKETKNKTVKDTVKKVSLELPCSYNEKGVDYKNNAATKTQSIYRSYRLFRLGGKFSIKVTKNSYTRLVQ